MNVKESVETICNKKYFFLLVLLLLDDTKYIIAIPLIVDRRKKYQCFKNVSECKRFLKPHLIKTRKEQKRKCFVAFSPNNNVVVVTFIGGVRLNEYNITNRKRTCEGDQCITL